VGQDDDLGAGAVNARPTSGETPRTPNSSGDTRVPIRRSDSPVPDSSKVDDRYVNIPENDRVLSRTISKSGAEKSNLSNGAPGIFSKMESSCDELA
jgi:hypothetical protein